MERDSMEFFRRIVSYGRGITTLICVFSSIIFVSQAWSQIAAPPAEAKPSKANEEPAQTRTRGGPYALYSLNRVTVRLHVKTGQTSLINFREFKPIHEPEAISEGDYEILLSHARDVTEVFRIEKKTGAVWALGFSDSDPRREKPRWFTIEENPIPPPLEKDGGNKSQ